MSRAQQKADTRATLKEAARSCFLAQGVEATPVSAIVREAGVAHGTFYVHFPDKAALLDELVGDFNRGLVDQLETVFEAHGVDAPETLVRATAQAFLKHWWAHRDFVAVVARRLSVALTLEELRDGVNPPSQAQVAAWLGRWQAQGHPLPRLQLVLQGLLAMWARVGMQALFHDQVTLDEAEEALVHMTLGVVRGPGGR